VLSTVDGLKRSVEMHESPYHGLNFCQGTVAEMLDDPAREITAPRGLLASLLETYHPIRPERG
jgi:D-mannonate dehydratase